LMPKSLSGPPGLWEAVRRIPPSVFLDLIKAETAGVERMVFWPMISEATPLPAARRMIFWTASGDCREERK
jgi:hypothetical protein